MHKNAHDPEKRTLRGDVLTVRAMRIHSAALGLSGECDVVEFHRDAKGITLSDLPDRWLPYPVEYKRGSPKSTECDEGQLCAQAMCLEEMLCCEIPEGSLYYGETRRRQVVRFTPELKGTVKEAALMMHQYFDRGYTPKARRTKSCNACSLKDLCLPGMMNPQPVHDYMKRMAGLDER